MKNAGVADRIGAFAVDGIVIFLIGLVFNIAGTYYLGSEWGRGLLTLLCHIGLLCKDITGQSLGKKLFLLQIVREDGSRAPWYRLMAHNLTDFLWVIELLLVLASDTNTRLSDKLLHLRVIKQPKL